MMRTGRLLLAGSLVWLLTACSKEVPSAPRDNPLDLHNPQTEGDPYRLQVESTPDGPRLSWSRVEMPGIAGYLVYRREGEGEYELIRFVEEGATTLVDDSVVQGRQYDYKVEVTAERREVHEQALVPAGEFTMGSASGGSDEKPVHTVYLDAFYIGKYEVTNAQWNAYAQATWESTKSGPDDHPVVNVTWFDAHDYCSWAGMRLPTEAEWEKAARGMDGRTYPWGEGIDGNKANYNDSGDPFDNGTTPVGYYPSGVSPYGAYDMAGNVWEWVADRYDSGYYASSPSRNPQGPSSGTFRVLRGGSWFNSVHRLRAAARNGNSPSYDSGGYGFRCAQD